jgi:hypothetical protein
MVKLCFSRKRTLKNGLIGLIGGGLITVSNFVPSLSHSDDNLVAQDISLVTPDDQDGDSILDVFETNTGVYVSRTDTGTTNTMFSTDGGIHSDSIECFNPHNPEFNPTDTNPFSSASPAAGPDTTFLEASAIQNITTGNTNSVVASTWGIDGTLDYIETNGTFGNGTLYKKDLYNFGNGRVTLETGLSRELRFIDQDSLSRFTFFHKDDGTGKDAVFKVNRNTGAVTRAVPTLAQSLSYGIRNPQVAGRHIIDRQAAALDINALVMYGISDEDGPGDRQVVGFLLNHTGRSYGDWDGSSPVQMTNLSDAVGFTAVSLNGVDVLIREDHPDGKSTLYSYTNFGRIFNGRDPPFDGNAGSNLRAHVLSPREDGVTIPIAIDRNYAYWLKDVNNVYRHTNPLNFDGSDFDIQSTRMALDESTGEWKNDSIIVYTPLIDNQIGASASPEMKRLAFGDKHLEGNSNYNLYAGTFDNFCMINNTDEMDEYNGFKDQSGLSLEGNLFAHVFVNDDPLVSGDRKFHIGTRVLKPISNATAFGSRVAAIRKFPSKFRIVDRSGSNPNVGVYMRMNYQLVDLVTDSGIIDEETMTMVHEDERGVFREITTVTERNTSMRYIDFYNNDFSDIGVAGEILQAPTHVSEWNLYE